MELAAMMPLAKHLGVEIDEASSERVIGRLAVTAELCTAGSIVHGGTIMAFADCLGAIGGYLALPEGASMTTTIESKTNFLGGAPIGSMLIGTSEVVKAGKRLSVWQTRIHTQDGADVGMVTQTQMVLWPA